MIARIVLLMLLVATGAAGTAHAQVYRWTDKQGKIHFGDDPSTAGARSPVNITPAPGAQRTTASGASATQAQKPPQAKTGQQLEAEFQARQGTQRHQEEARAKAVAESKAKQSQQRAAQNREDLRTMQETTLQADRAANRARSQSGGARQSPSSGDYNEALRRRKAGESTERTY